MKRRIFNLILFSILLISLFLPSFAEADVEPTIVKGEVLIFNEDGYIYGTDDVDGMFLQNVVELTEDEKNLLNEEDFISYENGIRVYRLNNDLVICVDGNSSEITNKIRINFIDSVNSEIKARAYNITTDKYYKTVELYDDMKVEFASEYSMSFNINNISRAADDNHITEYMIAVAQVDSYSKGRVLNHTTRKYDSKGKEIKNRLLGGNVCDKDKRVKSVSFDVCLKDGSPLCEIVNLKVGCGWFNSKGWKGTYLGGGEEVRFRIISDDGNGVVSFRVKELWR